jgi:hypothetical protein
MPSDLSDVGRRVFAEWKLGGVSAPSWLGADALLTHDWDTPSRSIVVTNEQEMDE